MSYAHAVVLGLVQGLTEFLPVSSTGHLILVGHVLGFTGALAASIEISIQLGSILAIVAYERTKLLSLVSQAIREQAALRELIRTSRHEEKGPVGERWISILRRSADKQRNLWFLIGLGVAFVPAAIIGFIAHGWIDDIEGRVISIKWGPTEEEETDVETPRDAPVLKMSLNDKSLIKPGAHVFAGAQKDGNGRYVAVFIIVGKDGIVPPL